MTCDILLRSLYHTCCSEHVRPNRCSYFQIYAHRDLHHASHPIQVSEVPKRRTIQRRPSRLGVPPRPRYKFTRRLGAPSCNVIVAQPDGAETTFSGDLRSLAV